MKYTFSYRTEDMMRGLTDADEWPEQKDFTSSKDNLEDAFEEFLNQDFGELFMVDPEVSCEDDEGNISYESIMKFDKYIW